MKRTTKVLTVILLITMSITGSLVLGDKDNADEELKEFLSRVMTSPYAHFIPDQQELLRFGELLYKTAKLWPQPANNSPKNDEPELFFCDVFGPTEGGPSSVHALRPGDIDVVLAMGDSISAGFGALSRDIFQLFNEYRGVSWSIGGEDNISTVYTLPNALRQYNANLTGYAVGNGKQDSLNARLDQAVSGAIGEDMPSQARTLIEDLTNDPTYDIQNSWKHLTIFIGGNDLCKVCKDEEANTPANYIASIEEALDLLQANVPRLFVSLVPFVDVTRLSELSQGLCIPLHWYLCPCAVLFDSWKEKATQAFEEYYTGLIALTNQSKYIDSDTFTVVLQPFMVDTDIPLISGTNEHDRSYFAPDCFHFSEKAHAAAAVALWNSLFEPVGQKETSWHPNEPYVCPTPSNPFLRTVKNSLPVY